MLAEKERGACNNRDIYRERDKPALEYRAAAHAKREVRCLSERETNKERETDTNLG